MKRALKIGLICALAGVATSAIRAATPTLIPMDVGTPGVAGSTTVDGNKITVVGGGNDIWNAADNFHYAYFQVTGDFDYVMQVISLTGNAGDGGWSKVELMARRPDSENGIDTPGTDDPHISNMTTRPSSDTPEGGAAGVNYRGPQWRGDRAVASTWTAPNPAYPPNMPNNYIRMERIGNTFWMYTSNDGVTWNGYEPYAYQGWDTAGSWPPGTDNPDVAFFTNAWPAKINLGIAVTAHSDADFTTAVVSNFVAYTPKPISITTQPPATKDVVASQTLELTVVAAGDPVHYEWRKDGTPIPRAVRPTLSYYPVTPADAGSYTCRVYGGGTEIITTPTVVTVTVDTVAPKLRYARADGSFTAVNVTFDEPMGPSATNAANYSISPSVAVTAAVSTGLDTVKLTTAAQAQATDYTLTVNNVKDLSGNTIAANSTVTFKSAELLSGFAYYERWNDANGDEGDLATFSQSILDGTIRTPDVAFAVSQFGGPWGATDNYNARVRTFFTPATAGNYVFFVAADDNARVYLSSDDKPAGKLLIAAESGWSNQYQWTVPGAGAPEDKRSDLYAGTEWGNTITLVAGKRYYMEVQWNEGGGGDGADVTFIKQGDADPSQNTDGMFMRGSVIGWYESIDNLPPTITTQPADPTTLAPGGTVTLSVVAAGKDLSYQWTLNGKNIAGATEASYTISNAGLDDIGQYQVVISNPVSTTTSSTAKVLVTTTEANVFNIEAEDFNYGSGQTKAEASTMPYKGGAYTNLTAVFDIDYHNTDVPTDSQTGDPAHPVYRHAPTGSTSDLETASRGVNIADNLGGQWGTTRGGAWDMTANYKIGWIGGGDWGNYTRTFPAGEYEVFCAQSYDGTAAGQLDSVIGWVTGVTTTTQTVDNFGWFNATGSQGWSRNNLVRMTDQAGAPKKVTLTAGEKTLRWNYNSGDADYLMFVKAGTIEPPPPLAVVLNANGSITITYSGGTLVSSGTVNGTFTDVTGATSPYTATPTATTFYKVKLP